MIDLFIAGHGKRQNGVFDTGASGFLTKGEHRYMTEDIFPAMQKYLPDGAKPIFHTKYNVYDYGNIVTLAKNYGKNVRVTEFHFDSAGNPNAKGGHVIVYKGFKPDDLDLKLRNAIRDTVGINSVYVHGGEVGVSGRDNLGNTNKCANAGINYRLLELGFGSNKNDANYMIKNVDTIAKELVKAFYGTTKSETDTDKLYRVQVGAYKKLENAKQMQKELRGKGYTDSFII